MTYKLTEPLKKRFILKEQAAIDAINSEYSYDQVKFFFNLIPDLMKGQYLDTLDIDEKRQLLYFVRIISRLVDSPELGAILKKFTNQPTLRITQQKRSTFKVKIQERSEIMSDHILQWLAIHPDQKPAKKEDGLVAVDGFFTSLIFFRSFTLWVIQSNFKSTVSVVEVLDKYYAWFPIVPFIIS